jgi:PAS domain-containing protein
MLHPPDHGVTTSEGSLAGVRPALDSHRRSAGVFIRSTGRIDHNRCLIASHGVFSGQLANQAGRVRIPPLRYSRGTPGVPRRDPTFTVIVCTPGSPLSTSPDSFAHRTHQTVPANAETNGHDKFMDSELRRGERRRWPSPGRPEEYLRALPALILLDRLPIPMLATGLDGLVVYTNPAFATMLGHHPDTVMLTGQQLPALLAGHATTPPRDCVTALRAASNVIVDWLHVEGFPVRSVISETLFFRASDQVLLFGVTDITELIWTTPPAPR